MSIRGWYAGLVALLFLPAAPAVAAWQEARSPHFLVYADDKPERVREFATRLEKFDRALRALFVVADTGETSSRRVTVYVVDDAGDVAKLMGKGGSNVAGFYIPRATGAVAFVPRNGSNGKFALSPETVLLHEYGHHFMFSTWPNLAVPAWFAEGFAEFTATALFNKDGGITIGSPPLYRARAILDPTMSLKRIISADLSTLPPDLRSQIYGRGWLLTHYLLLSDDHRQLFNAYLAALNSGKGPVAAAAVFGDLDALDRALTRYATNRLSGFVLKPDMLQIGPVSVTPLTEGAAAVMPARILSDRGVNRTTAASVYALATQLAAPYPADPTAQNVLAEAALDAGQIDAAIAAADRAIAADPHSLHALVYRGRAAMAKVQRAGQRDSANWGAVRRYFLAANKVDTENAEPLFLFYQSFVRAGDTPTKNAQEALAYAYRLAPFDPSLRLTAANMFLHQRNAEAAREALAPIAYNPHGGRLAELATRILAALDQDGPEAALATKDGPKADDDDPD